MVQGSIPLRTNKFSQGKSIIRNHVEDRAPLQNIFFGGAVVRSDDTERAGRLPNMNKYVGVLSGDLVSGGTVTMTGKIIDADGNETAIALSETFDTDHATTATAIKDYLEGLDADLTCTLSNSNRTFTVEVVGDKRLSITTGFTRGGSGSTSFTNTKGTNDTVRGFAEKGSVPQLLTFDPTDEPEWTKAQNQMMPVLYDGQIALKAYGTPTDGAAVYALLEDYTDTDTNVNERGSVRPDTDSGSAPVVLVSGAAFASSKDNGLAAVAIKQA